MNAMLGDLPTWNLADLYSSPTGPDLEADLKRAGEEAAAFQRDFEGKIAALDGKPLGSSGRAALMAACTSRAAALMLRESSNCSTTRVEPSELELVISVTPAMRPRLRSSGAATVAAVAASP